MSNKANIVSAKTPIILASRSPRRIELLKKWGLDFRVIPSNAREVSAFKKPADIVKDLALKKAMSVSKKIKKGIVIGADTIVVLGNQIIGKPKNKSDAKRILGKLNGSCHKVYSGIAVCDASRNIFKTGFEVSRVKMRKLDDSDVERLSVKHMDKAGAYAVQEKEDAFVEKIEGDYFNVVGLPYFKLKKMLLKFGIMLGHRSSIFAKF
jgi:septum formation protein